MKKNQLLLTIILLFINNPKARQTELGFPNEMIKKDNITMSTLLTHLDNKTNQTKDKPLSNFLSNHVFISSVESIFTWFALNKRS